MKKYILGVLSIVLIAALLAAGCGSKSKSKEPSAEAKRIIKENQARMEEVQSVKMKGKGIVLTPQSETKEEEVAYEAEIKMVDKDNIEMHLVATESTGKKSEAYITGGYLYSFDQDAGWTKEKIQPGSEQASLLTPAGVADLSRFANDVKLNTGSGGKYVLTFDVGTKLFEKLFEQAAGGAESTMPESPATDELAQTMKDMLKGLEMGVVYKVDKKTMLADSATITMSMKGAPVIGDLSMDMKLTFFEYNVPVTITVPPDALNAPEVQPSDTGVPSIPSLPGFSL